MHLETFHTQQPFCAVTPCSVAEDVYNHDMSFLDLKQVVADACGIGGTKDVFPVQSFSSEYEPVKALIRRCACCRVSYAHYTPTLKTYNFGDPHHFRSSKILFVCLCEGRGNDLHLCKIVS